MLRLAPRYAGSTETWPHGAEFFVVNGRSGNRRRLEPCWFVATLAARDQAGAESHGGALLYRETGHLG